VATRSQHGHPPIPLGILSPIPCRMTSHTGWGIVSPEFPSVQAVQDQDLQNMQHDSRKAPREIPQLFAGQHLGASGWEHVFFAGKRRGWPLAGQTLVCAHIPIQQKMTRRLTLNGGADSIARKNWEARGTGFHLSYTLLFTESLQATMAVGAKKTSTRYLRRVLCPSLRWWSDSIIHAGLRWRCPPRNRMVDRSWHSEGSSSVLRVYSIAATKRSNRRGTGQWE